MSPPTDDPNIEYDADSGTYHVTYDPAEESPGITIVAAIAAITDTDAVDLDQLNRYVDADALEALFGPTREQRGNHGSLSFTYEGFQVVVHSDGEIELREQV